MLTKIMMWVSIAMVLLALLELPVTSEPLLLEIVVCASGLLVMCRRSTLKIQYLYEAIETDGSMEHPGEVPCRD